MITVLNPNQFFDLRNQKAKELISDLIEAQKRLLREEFDAALTDAHARAVIDIADTLDFKDLTRELEQDFEIEKLINL